MLCGYEACCMASMNDMHQHIRSTYIHMTIHSHRPMSERVESKMFKMANAAEGDGVSFLFFLVPVFMFFSEPAVALLFCPLGMSSRVFGGLVLPHSNTRHW